MSRNYSIDKPKATTYVLAGHLKSEIGFASGSEDRFPEE
jgi:hypothetical protein